MDTTALLKSVPTGLWIGGEERQAKSTFNVLDPSDDQVIATVGDATPEDAVAALDAACAVQAEWAATPARKRGEILRSVFETLTARADDIAALMTLEMGKVFAESKGEVTYGAEFFRWFAEEAVRIGGRYTPSPAGTGRIIVTKQAVGPCYAITPWNFPLAMGTRKMGPAFAAGCTMIVKPAQETPLTMLYLAKLCDEAGLPKGVLSVLPTSDPGGVTGALIDDGRLRKLTFTGSTGVGKALVKQSADKLLRTSMELGGNAPFIVFDDADVDAAVEVRCWPRCATGRGLHRRQPLPRCQRRPRGVHREAGEADERVHPRQGPRRILEAGPADQLQAAAEGHRAGLRRRLARCDRRRRRRRPGGPGNFYPATVLADVPADARILKEEVFGPVAPITGFDTEDEGVAAANDTEYGLAAYVYTQSLDRALRVAEAIESGMVGVNRGVISDAAAPFGGIKESGFGREGGTEGIEEYLDTKYIALTK